MSCTNLQLTILYNIVKCLLLQATKFQDSLLPSNIQLESVLMTNFLCFCISENIFIFDHYFSRYRILDSLFLSVLKYYSFNCFLTCSFSLEKQVVIPTDLEYNVSFFFLDTENPWRFSHYLFFRNLITTCFSPPCPTLLHWSWIYQLMFFIKFGKTKLPLSWKNLFFCANVSFLPTYTC